MTIKEAIGNPLVGQILAYSGIWHVTSVSRMGDCSMATRQRSTVQYVISDLKGAESCADRAYGGRTAFAAQRLGVGEAAELVAECVWARGHENEASARFYHPGDLATDLDHAIVRADVVLHAVDRSGTQMPQQLSAASSA